MFLFGNGLLFLNVEVLIMGILFLVWYFFVSWFFNVFFFFKGGIGLFGVFLVFLYLWILEFFFKCLVFSDLWLFEFCWNSFMFFFLDDKGGFVFGIGLGEITLGDEFFFWCCRGEVFGGGIGCRFFFLFVFIG